MKKLFAIFISLVLLLGCTAYAENGSYLFIKTDEGVWISGYEGDEAILRLPADFKGEPVTGICEEAFKGNRSIREVYVPDSYKVIGAGAFEGCTSLRDVYIGSGLERIEARAFRGCIDLLSVSIVQNEFEADPAAFDEYEDGIPYNGADIQLHLSQNTGDDYNLLYIAACDMMSRGEFKPARDIFLSLYGYELSADYYFYCAARLYEQQGDIDAAVAIYALMPDLNDCGARLEYYKADAAVASFFDCPEYTLYYEYYFGEGGIYAPWLDIEAAEQTEVDNAEAVIGGADGPTGIVVGDSVGAGAANDDTEAAEDEDASATEPVDATEAPADDIPEAEATVEPNPALMSFHDFCGDMPYSYDNRVNSDGYYALYFYYDDVQVIRDYAALFEENGWEVIEESEPDGWMYLYVMNETTGAYFMMGYSEADGMLILMYESGLPYDFDPVNGL